MAERKRRTSESAPMAAKARAKVKSRALLIFYFLVLLGVTVGAVLLCVFVFFKVGNIHITGTAAYTPQELAQASGVLAGDNLLFVDAQGIEQKLFSHFPYIEKVRVRKKIPSTLEIVVTEAQVGYSVPYGDGYVYISQQGKILEKASQPYEGGILLKAGEISDEGGRMKFAKPEYGEIFKEIQLVFSEHNRASITQIDISDIYNITLVYEGRIVFKLGNSADLAYKIRFGLQSLEVGEVGPEESGVLDLSQAKGANRGYFTPEALASSGSEEKKPPDNGESPGEEKKGEGESTQSPQEDEGESGADSPSSEEPEGDSASSKESPRGQDIPDVN